MCYIHLALLYASRLLVCLCAGAMPAVPIDPDLRDMKVKCLMKKAEWTKALVDATLPSSDGSLGVTAGREILG